MTKTAPPAGGTLRASHGRGPRVGARWTILVLACWTACIVTPAGAQTFSFERYYLECLSFEAGGDLTTARQSCLNALQVAPQRSEAHLALGRIEFGLGEYAAAETRLLSVRDRVAGAEIDLLLGEIVFAAGRIAEADGYADSARRKISLPQDVELAARLAMLEARSAEAGRNTEAALEAYARAIDLDGLDVAYRLADADLRWRLGDLQGAERALSEYELATGDRRNPDVKALLGRLAWVDGRNDEAVDLLETALALRDLRDSEGQAADLRVLATLYYGQGDVQRGGLVLREAIRRGNLLAGIVGNTLLWLLGLVVLLGLHLIGESRQSGEVAPQVEGPRRWSLGEAYGVLIAAALVGFAATMAYGLAVHGNLAVLFTPHQQHQARSVYLMVFGLVTALVAWQRVRRLGWNPGERLLGRSDGLVGGFVVGALLFTIVLSYLIYVPRSPLASAFFLDLASIDPLRIAALALVPLSELYFRGFLRPALEQRYGHAGLGLPIMALVWALAFATPLVVLLPIGFALAEIDRPRPNGLTSATAVWVAWMALAASATASPFVRGLFL